LTELRDLPVFEEDGLPIPEVGAWALEKYRRVWYYDQIFSTGMKAKWDQRVYIDLFSGPGFARIRGSGRIVAGSPILSLRVRDRFTKYIFCEEREDFLDTLIRRVEREAPGADVEYVLGDVNQVVHEVVARIPAYGQGNTQLSFCFADPFSVDLSFETIRALGGTRNMDFLILLALGMDANRNLGVYLEESHERIERFLGDPDWRERWREAEGAGLTFTYFLALRYLEAMRTLGYMDTTPDQMYPVRSDTKNLGLYYLAFFSKARLGGTFWREVLHYSDEQLGFRL
jgi:three-Cys-motif partner protein